MAEASTSYRRPRARRSDEYRATTSRSSLAGRPISAVNEGTQASAGLGWAANGTATSIRQRGNFMVRGLGWRGLG